MKNKENLVIIGSGELAREVIDLNNDIDALDGKGYNILGIMDNNNTSDLELPFYKDIPDIQDFRKKKYCIAINDNSKRFMLLNKLKKYKLDYANIIHPTALIRKSSIIHSGCIIFPYVTIGIRANICSHVILNTSSCVGHDALIGEFCNISPGAIVSGNCSLGKGVYIGSNSVLHQGIKFGEWSVLSPNSYASRNFGSKKLVSSGSAKTILTKN